MYMYFLSAIKYRGAIQCLPGIMCNVGCRGDKAKVTDHFVNKEEKY